MRKDRAIDVKKQRNMTLKETLLLCISGVKHRFLRSILTLAVVVLAVAFFMFLLGESMFLRAVGRGVKAEISEMRFSQQKLSWLFTPAADVVMMRRLSDAYRGSTGDVMKEFSVVTGFSQAEITELAEMADKEKIYTEWLSSLPVGKRAILVHKNTDRNAIKYILDDYPGFHDRIKNMVDLKIPGQIKGLDYFLNNYVAYSEKLHEFTLKWNANVALSVGVMNYAKRESPKTSNDDWIINATPEELDDWRLAIVALGFDLSADAVAFIKKQLTHDSEFLRVFAMLSDAKVRQDWAREFRETLQDRSTPETKLLQLNDARAKKIMKEYFPEDVLNRVAATAKQKSQILKAERKLISVVVDDGNQLFGLSGRQFFLVVISFVVCMVGIANAMLMSITERFREIATMKCLGATDRYILTQFMMEAALHGLFGGFIGVVLGFLIAFAQSAMSFGGYVFLYWPGVDLYISVASSICAGILLAVVASIQPSWSASRMAPMEAMRVE